MESIAEMNQYDQVPSTGTLLGELSSLYKQQLEGDDSTGKEILAKLGIHSRETIDAFQIGYSDGKLAEKVNPEQVKDLQALGILTHNKREKWSRALIFPAFDPETGIIMDLFALKYFRFEKTNLQKKPSGLMNIDVLNAAREIIVTDWMEAALKIHCSGWPAVIPIRGVQNLSDHLNHFRNSQMETVWVASLKNGKSLETLLVKAGLNTRRLILHHDFREIDSATLKNQMDSACNLPDAQTKPHVLEFTEDGVIFGAYNSRFKISGMKGNSDPSSMKLVLTVCDGDREHADRIDLLLASHRRRLARDSGRVLGVDSEIIGSVLMEVVPEVKRVLVERTEKRLVPSEIQPTGNRMSDALKALQKPNLIENISKDLRTLGLVGEQENALLLFLVAVSRKLTRPLSAILRSESASGKSNLVERIVELQPDSETVYVSRLTPNSLFHMPPEALKHRLVLVEEREGSSEADYAVRILQSKGFLTTAIPLPPEETGVPRTKLITVQGPVAYIETSTRKHIDPQNLNRCFEITMDESPEQTARILLERQRRRAMTHERTGRETIFQKHRDMQSLLSTAPIQIPFAKELTFPAHQVRFRRDHERLLGLIDASCLLHQHQRQWRTNPRGEKMIVAEISDYELAFKLCRHSLALATDELSSHGRQAWDSIQTFHGEPFTRRELMEKLSWSYWKTYTSLRELKSLDLIGYQTGKGPHPGTYRVRCYSPNSPELGLISPEELAQKLSVAVVDEQTD
jgi:hypothetical protein